MDSIIGIFVTILVLIIATWVAIFGGIGAVLSRSRGSTGAAGFAWGTGLGPLGWLAVLWTTRGRDEESHGESVIPTGPAKAADSLLDSRPPTVPVAAADRWDPWNK